MACSCSCHDTDRLCEECCEGGEINTAMEQVLRDYLKAHRRDIEMDINDFGELKPLLPWLDTWK